MSDDEEQRKAVDRLAEETLALLAAVGVAPARERAHALAAVAMRRLAVLLAAEARASSTDEDLLLLYARAVLETWLTGHASLLLGEDGRSLLEQRRRLVEAMADPRASSSLDAPPMLPPVTLLHLAKQLDEHVYGVSDAPKAFQRHLRSFFDEIDVRRADGTAAMLDTETDPAPGTGARRSTRTDVLRVSLWVVLFLARYYFDAVGDAKGAAQAYDLFRQLRDATATFYQDRRPS